MLFVFQKISFLSSPSDVLRVIRQYLKYGQSATKRVHDRYRNNYRDIDELCFYKREMSVVSVEPNLETHKNCTKKKRSQ